MFEEYIATLEEIMNNYELSDKENRVAFIVIATLRNYDRLLNTNFKHAYSEGMIDATKFISKDFEDCNSDVEKIVKSCIASIEEFAGMLRGGE